MRTKKKKIPLLSLLTLFIAVLCLLPAACGSTDDVDPTKPGGEIVDKDPYVKSVEILTNPRTEYEQNEIFDPGGLLFNAVWDIDGEDETIEMNASDCDSYTLSGKPLTLEDKEVVFTIGGFDFTIGINVTKAENKVLLDDTFDGDYNDDWKISQSGNTYTTVTQGSSFVNIKKTTPVQYGFLVSKTFTAPKTAFMYGFRAKINSSLDAERSVAEFSVRGNGAYLIRVVLTFDKANPTQGSVRDDYDSATKTFTLDTSVMHDYLVVVNSSYSYDLYVDGELAWSGAAKKTQSGGNLVKMGADNTLNAPGSGVMDFDVDYFKVETGTYAPEENKEGDL